MSIKKLRNELTENLVKNSFQGKFFLPENALKQLITVPSIRKCLPDADAGLVYFVYMQARRVFVTTLQIGPSEE